MSGGDLTTVEDEVDVQTIERDDVLDTLADPRLVTIAATPEALTGMRETTAAKVPVYFAALAKGCGRQEASVIAGIAYSCIKGYRKNNKHFRVLEKSSELVADARMSNNMMTAADGGSVAAMALWMKKLRRWVEPEKRIKIDDNRPNGPTINLTTISDDVVLQMAKLLNENAGKAEAITVDVLDEEMLALTEDADDYNDSEDGDDDD